MGIDTGRWWDCESVAQTPGAGKREGAGARAPLRDQERRSVGAHSAVCSSVGRLGENTVQLLHNFRQMLRIFRFAAGALRRAHAVDFRNSVRAAQPLGDGFDDLRLAVVFTGNARIARAHIAGSRLRKDARLSPERPPRAWGSVSPIPPVLCDQVSYAGCAPGLLLSAHLDRECAPAPNPIPLRADEGLILDCGGPLCQKDARSPQMGGQASSRPRLKSDRPEAIFQSARCSDIGSARIGCRACRGKG